MKERLMALALLTLWGCDAPCDHAPYCSADGTTIIRCDESGQREVQSVCRDVDRPACVEAAPGWVICAVKAEPEALCERTELNDFVCDGNVRKICIYGYLSSQEDCTVDNSTCECEDWKCYCVAPDEE
jgi:hypothetical protein